MDESHANQLYNSTELNSSSIESQTYLEYIGYNHKRLPRGYWKKKENHKKYIEWLGKKLGYTTMEHWYKISTKDFKNNYGNRLLTYYNHSYVKLVTSMYPEYNWIIWKFKVVPNSYWQNKENHTKYMDWLGKKLGYTTKDDWYNISVVKDITDNDGGGLLKYYNHSYVKLVTSMYPEYNWIIWKFKVVPKNYWQNKENHIKYMDWLGKELGYTTKDDWYNISTKDVKNNYGDGLLMAYYNSSSIELVTSIYPDYNWIIWKFKFVTNNYWKNKENHTKYIEWLGKGLGYTTMEDWYKISQKDLKNNYGGGLLNKYYNGSPSQLVIKMFPDYNWDKSKFINYKTEALTHNFLSNNKCKLGIVDIILQYSPDWCINPDTGRKLPYDFRIELVNGTKIIIECDGEQHYSKHRYFHKNDRAFENQQERDIIKMNSAFENNISIIRFHQEDVWNNTIDWEKELIDAISEIKNGNEITMKALGCVKDKAYWEDDEET